MVYSRYEHAVRVAGRNYLLTGVIEHSGHYAPEGFRVAGFRGNPVVPSAVGRTVYRRIGECPAIRCESVSGGSAWAQHDLGGMTVARGVDRGPHRAGDRFRTQELGRIIGPPLPGHDLTLHIGID